MRGQALTKRNRLRLAGSLVGGGDAAAFEFIQRHERGGVIVEFDEAGGFGEAAAGFFFLCLQDVPVDYPCDDQQ